MILLIDNYDSFTYNLRRYLRQLGQEVEVVRNDSIRLDEVLNQAKAIIISPGPKAPKEAGECLRITREFSGRIPILGICLGHQVICEAFGGKIIRALQPTHGRSSKMRLAESRLFTGIPDETRFARYHSLVADRECFPETLRITAESCGSEIMAVEHKKHPVFGVQFHPESILSSAGHRLIANFLAVAELPITSTLPPPDLTASSQPNLNHANALVAIDNESHAVFLPKNHRRLKTSDRTTGS